MEAIALGGTGLARLEEEGRGWRRERGSSDGSGDMRSIRGEPCWWPEGFPLQLEM